MRTPKHFMTAIAIALAGSCAAQDPGEIHGRALEPDGKPAMYANVSARQGDRLVGTQAGDDGRFVLKPLAPGTWTVEISYVGMNIREIKGVQVQPGRITPLDDELLTANDALPIFETIYWKRKLIEIDDPGRMSLLASELKGNPNVKSMKSLVQKEFPGISTGPNGDGLYFRGARSENMASYIDGVRVPGTVPSIPSSAISSISVYTGGLPARYGDVTGGVVVIETKTYFEMYEERRALEAAVDQ